MPKDSQTYAQRKREREGQVNATPKKEENEIQANAIVTFTHMCACVWCTGKVCINEMYVCVCSCACACILGSISIRLLLSIKLNGMFITCDHAQSIASLTSTSIGS